MSESLSPLSSETCRGIADHMLLAAGGDGGRIVDKSRLADYHDVCLDLLSNEAPAGSGQKLILPEDRNECTLSASGGVVGFRVLFLHGLGVKRLVYKDRPTTAGGYKLAYDGWQGRRAHYAVNKLEGIADVRYYITDTTIRGWDHPALQREYCAAIARFKPHVIFTHSMGNLIVAGAVGSKVPGCESISKTAAPGKITWFSIQAPWSGSPVATAAEKACNTPAKGLWNKIKAKVIDIAQPCGEQPAQKSLAYEHKSSGPVQLSDLKSIANSHVSGAMCSVDAEPLTVSSAFSKRTLGVWFLNEFGQSTGIVDWKQDKETRLSPKPYLGNDGAVAYRDCDLGRNYEQNPQQPNYVGRIGHMDGPCFQDDVGSNALKHPCAWLSARVKDARASRGRTTTMSLNNASPSRGSTYCSFRSFSYPSSFVEHGQTIRLSSGESQSLAAEKAYEASYGQDADEHWNIGMLMKKVSAEQKQQADQRIKQIVESL